MSPNKYEYGCQVTTSDMAGVKYTWTWSHHWPCSVNDTSFGYSRETLENFSSIGN